MDKEIESTRPDHSPNPIESPQTPPSPASEDPGFDSVYKYLMFGLSLPERTIRSTAAMVGGTIHESAGLLVPQAFQDSKTYEMFVRQMLDLLNKDVGGVGQNENQDKNGHR